MKFKNKTAIITGASRGIGKAAALLFAKEGANVVIDYFVSDYEPDAKENAESLFSEITTTGGKAIIVSCDVRKEIEIASMIEQTMKAFGTIDILVNNAAYVVDKPITERTLDEWHRTIDTNLLGTYLCTKLISENMSDGGAIVNASSTNAINYNNPESIDYDASKAGVISLTKNFAKELAPRSIRVNATALSWADTEMNTQLPKELLDEEKEGLYLKRFADLEEVANLYLFLAGPDSSYITGSTIVIDGGHD